MTYPFLAASTDKTHGDEDFKQYTTSEEASQALARKLGARNSMRNSQWWGRFEDGKYEGCLAGKNDVSDVIEGFLSNLANKALRAKEVEGVQGEHVIHAEIAEYVIRFMTKTVLPYALSEQRDLEDAADSLEELT